MRPGLDLPDEGETEAVEEIGEGAQNLDLILNIPVSVKIVLGSAIMPVGSLVKLGRGAVIPLDRGVGEPVDVVVNGRTIARGEVVVMDEVNSRFGISLTEVVVSKPSNG
jgi:flagellar motor switch protein FliN/FliY